MPGSRIGRQRVMLDAVRPLEDESFPSSSIKNQITRLIVTRAAVNRWANPALADEYHKLAMLGAVNPAVYATVLRSPAGPVTVESVDDLIACAFSAA